MQMENKHIQIYTTWVFCRELEIKQVTTVHLLEWHVVKSLSRVQLFATPPTRFLSPWDVPGKNTGVRCYFLLQEIFLIHRSNPHLLIRQEWLRPPLPPAKKKSDSISCWWSCKTIGRRLLQIVQSYKCKIVQSFWKTLTVSCKAKYNLSIGYSNHTTHWSENLWWIFITNQHCAYKHSKVQESKGNYFSCS